MTFTKNKEWRGCPHALTAAVSLVSPAFSACLNHRLRGFWDCTDAPTTLPPLCPSYHLHPSPNLSTQSASSVASVSSVLSALCPLLAFHPPFAFSLSALWATPLSALYFALCPSLYSRLSSAFRFFFLGPVGYASVCSVRCPLPYSRLSSAFNPLICVICVICDSDNLPTPSVPLTIPLPSPVSRLPFYPLSLLSAFHLR